MYPGHYVFPEGFRIGIAGVFDGISGLEDASRQQPAGYVVLGLQLGQIASRQGGDYAFCALEVVCARNLVEFAVGHHEVSESELSSYILSEFMDEGLRTLHQESSPQALRHAAHAFLRGLHQDGHLGNLPADEFAEIYAGIQFLVRGPVTPVQHKADIGDDPQHLLLVALEGGDGVVVVGGEEYLRPGALAEYLLLLVQGVFQRGDVLLQHQFVEQGEVG